MSRLGYRICFTVTRPGCVLNNLIGNSFKFTESGSVILAVDETDRTDDNVTLRWSVTDTGIGISEADRDKLFRAFEQIDGGLSRRHEGTGLGLRISDQLIRLMGGRIDVDSRPGEGSTFTFTLTLPYDAENTSLFHSEAYQDKSFLIVDDNPAERVYLDNILRSWKIRADTAADGDEALKKIDGGAYDYLLLDWKMAGLDGLDILKRLAESQRSIPNVLMITAFEKEQLFIEANKRGVTVQKVLQKPYTLSTLFETLFEKPVYSPRNDTQQHVILEQTARALLVEDNETNRIVAEGLLTKIGFSVKTASDGQCAVQMARASAYDIIFMDVQMPVMDGYEASRQIRSFDTSTPIIALSAAVMKRDIDHCLEAGMNEHLAKPIETAELERCVMHHFTTRLITSDTAALERPEPINGVDIERLIATFDGDLRKTYVSLVRFADAERQTVDTLRGLDVTDAAFNRLIHRLKGASGNLGIHEVHALCRQIETEPERREILKMRLIASLEAVITRLETLTKGTDAPLASEYARQLDKSITALQNSEYVPQETVNAISEYVRRHVDPDTAAQILRHYTDFETEALLNLFETLRQRITP